MKKILLVLFTLSFSVLAKSQAPGIKWKNPNPSFFKVDLPKQKGFGNSWLPGISQNVNRVNKILPLKNFPSQAVISSPIDGMSCLVVDPSKIDPKMLVKIKTSPLNYRMPNPLSPPSTDAVR